MKKLILFIFLGIFLVSFISASNCELATPRYGVLQCDDTGQKNTLDSSFGGFDGEWSKNEIDCLSNCKISSREDIITNCDGLTDWSEVIITRDGTKKETYPIEWNRDDELIVYGRCKTLFSKNPLPSSAEVEYSEDEIKIYEGWAGSLINNPVSGTEGCILNKEYESIDLDYYFDTITETKETSPESTYPSINGFPNSWEIGDKFIFVKDWETGIADISLTYDKEGDSFWCGGNYGNRKIYSVQEVNSGGNCYSIPQSIYKSNIECCFPVDCEHLGNEYTCNPDSWKCEMTRPCNSQLDCESTFGEGVCESGEIIMWTCNTNKEWGDYSGTCEQESKFVEECPEDCSSKEYYSEEQGKCLTRKDIEYEEKQKEIEREASNLDVQESSSLDAEISSSKQSSSIGKTILIIFLVIILGSIGFFIYIKNKDKKKSFKKEIHKEVGKKSKHCTKCGSILRLGSKFCNKCGKKVRKEVWIKK